MSTSTSLTNKEYFKLNGTLSAERIEGLLDLESAVYVDVLEDIITSTKEAITQFPEEDFLQPVISELNTLLKTLRGDNRLALANIITAVEDIQSDITNSSEYALANLNSAIETINNIITDIY